LTFLTDAAEALVETSAETILRQKWTVHLDPSLGFPELHEVGHVAFHGLAIFPSRTVESLIAWAIETLPLLHMAFIRDGKTPATKRPQSAALLAYALPSLDQPVSALVPMIAVPAQARTSLPYIIESKWHYKAIVIITSICSDTYQNELSGLDDFLL
jgi:hypothetical protein